jgi:hypothetical protein
VIRGPHSSYAPFKYRWRSYIFYDVSGYDKHVIYNAIDNVKNSTACVGRAVAS